MIWSLLTSSSMQQTISESHAKPRASAFGLCCYIGKQPDTRYRVDWKSINSPTVDIMYP